MRRILLLTIFAAMMLQGCEESLSNEAVETMTVTEIAALANSDENVALAFLLHRQITDARTEGVLSGATLPDGPGTSILATSISVGELTTYLNDHDFKNAERLATLYTERNGLLEGFQIKYKAMVDKLSSVEKEELNELLPPTSGTITAEDAVKLLPTR